MTVVVDASVVVAALSSGGATGGWAESVLAGEPLAAPHLLPVEAASILRRAEREGEISADAASLAYADLGRLRVEYFPYAPFAERIWELCATLPGSPQQEALLERVRSHIAGAQASRKRIELEISALLESSGELERQAGKAIAAGRPDLAREAMDRRTSIHAELSGLRTQDHSLRETQDKLIAVSERAHPVNLGCYDAWYVALAEFLGVKLATLNARLAQAPGPRCGFWLPPAESAPGP
jgi:predicted nucleic acid-binding protein